MIIIKPNGCNFLIPEHKTIFKSNKYKAGNCELSFNSNSGLVKTEVKIITNPGYIIADIMIGTVLEWNNLLYGNESNNSYLQETAEQESVELSNKLKNMLPPAIIINTLSQYGNWYQDCTIEIDDNLDLSVKFSGDSNPLVIYGGKEYELTKKIYTIRELDFAFQEARVENYFKNLALVYNDVDKLSFKHIKKLFAEKDDIEHYSKIGLIQFTPEQILHLIHLEYNAFKIMPVVSTWWKHNIDQESFYTPCFGPVEDINNNAGEKASEESWIKLLPIDIQAYICSFINFDDISFKN
jgi:hypothetical protein